MQEIIDLIKNEMFFKPEHFIGINKEGIIYDGNSLEIFKNITFNELLTNNELETVIGFIPDIEEYNPEYLHFATLKGENDLFVIINFNNNQVYITKNKKLVQHYENVIDFINKNKIK